MNKKLLMGTGGLLLIMNAGVAFCPDSNAKVFVQALSAACGLVVLFLAGRAAIPAPPAKASEPAFMPPPPPAPRPEAEIVAFLALLQERGRLVDFVRENITEATDEQLGSAARVVHAGCRKVLDEYFDIRPIHSEAEGTRVELGPDYDASAHRLLGSVPEKPPYQGQLLHPGWMAESVKLPRITGVTEKRPWPVLAPAEVDLG